MLHAVMLLSLFGTIPALQATGQIPCNAAETGDLIATADGALIKNHTFISAAAARIHGVIDRAVAYTLIVH